MGNGDGTFQSTPQDGPLAEPGWTVTAIAVGDWNNNNLPDIAFTETGPDGSEADLCVLVNEGGGTFEPSLPLPVDPDPDAIQSIDFGDGIVDLAVADSATGDVAIFVGNGQGGFLPGLNLAGGEVPSAMVAGRLGDGHVDLIVADEGDPTNNNQGQGLTVFQADGPDEFNRVGTIAAGLGPSAIVAGDFTGNGDLDLAIADSNSDLVTVLLNNGNGTFAAPRVLRSRQPSAGACGGRLRQRPRRPGGRQRRFRRRLGPPGQRRRQLPAPATVRRRFVPRVARDARSRPAPGGSTWPPATRARATSPSCWAAATAPSRIS